MADAARFRQTTLAVQDGAVLLYLLTSGVMRALAGGAKTAEALGAELGVQGPRLRQLLDHAMGLGFLVREGERYGLCEGDAEHFEDLGFERSVIWGGYEGFLGALLSMPQAMREGPQRQVAGTGADVDGAERDAFIRYLHSRSIDSAVAFADQVGDVGRVLDLGCGLGTYAAELARRWPSMTGVLVDRPNAADSVATFLAEEGLTDRLEFRGGELLDMDLSGDWDLVIMSNLVHNLGEPRSRALLAKLRPTLAPGGRVAIKDIAVKSDRSGPVGALRFGVTMATATEDGDVFPADEVRGWMAEAGFAVEEVDLEGSYLLLGSAGPGLQLRQQ